jgi:outer membrane protein OmpA-like peptidoglycan-associated protein
MKANQLKLSVFSVVIALILSVEVLAGVPAKDDPKTASLNKKAGKSKVDLKDVRIKNVEFGFNKAEISAASFARLNQTAQLMMENKAGLKLNGHADNKGGYVYNWKLSQARANAVKEYLISRGADSSRIAATEFGDTKPIASNNTKIGRKKNRRVEINFVQ